MRRLITALAALGALLVAGAMAAASGGATVTPSMPAYSGPLSRHVLQRRPYTVVISGDGSNFLAGRGQAARRPDTGRLTWTQWNASDGRGWGANWIDDCEPSCAQGTLHPYRVTVHVYRPRRIAGHRLFTRLSITYIAGRPSYIKKRTSSLRLVYRSRLLFWNP